MLPLTLAGTPAPRTRLCALSLPRSSPPSTGSPPTRMQMGRGASGAIRRRGPEPRGSPPQLTPGAALARCRCCSGTSICRRVCTRIATCYPYPQAEAPCSVPVSAHVYQHCRRRYQARVRPSGSPDPVVTKSIAKYIAFLLNPAKMKAFGVMSTDTTSPDALSGMLVSGFVGMAAADLIQPWSTFRQ